MQALAQAISLSELLQQQLKSALSSVEKHCQSEVPEKEEVLKIPEAKSFVDSLELYKIAGEELVNDNITWLLLNYFGAKQNTEVRHIYEVIAACYSHPAPKTVAKAFIREVEGSIENAIPHHFFRHSDLVYSHHDERIREGTIYCKDCDRPAEISFSSKIHELVASADRKKAEDAIMEKFARYLWQSDDVPKRKKKSFPAFKGAVIREMEALLNVCGNYETLYDAFEQTRFYTVVLEDMIRNSISSLPAEGIMDNRHLLNKGIKELQEIIAAHIDPPLLVLETRVKGQSLVDKTILKHYEHVIQKDFRRGRLGRFLKERGIPERDDYYFNLEDLVGIKAIVHGDAVSYVIKPGKPRTNTGERKAQKKVYELMSYMLDCGYGQVHDPELFEGSFIEGRGLRVIKVKDYIKNPKRSGYKAFHLVIEADYNGIPVQFELQAKSNFMDNLAELTERQSHDGRKLEQRALVDYLVETGSISRRTVEIYRILLSPGQEYR